MFDLLAVAADPQEHVVDHLLWQVNGFWLLSNHIVMILIVAALMMLIFPMITKGYRDGQHVPSGSRNFFEAIIVYLRNDVAKPLLGDETDRFMPFFWTLFFFILFCNLIGLLPLDAIQTAIQGGHHAFHPISGTATSNFYVTATLALVVFCVIQFQGIVANGFDGWLHHFLGGAPWWLAPIMVPVEILGMLIKPFALAVRLAANMTAGHLLLAVLAGFVPLAFENIGTGGGILIGFVAVIASVLIMMLELFVALLQAYLFVFLSALFISQLITHHGHDDHHDEEAEGNELGEPHAIRAHDAEVHHGVKPAH